MEQSRRHLPPAATMSEQARRFLHESCKYDWGMTDLATVQGLKSLREETAEVAEMQNQRVVREETRVTVVLPPSPSASASSSSSSASPCCEIAGVPVVWVHPASSKQQGATKTQSENEKEDHSASKRKNCVVLHFHGGGAVSGAPEEDVGITARLAHHLGLSVCAPKYRLAPEHPFPAACEDAAKVYRALLRSTTTMATTTTRTAHEEDSADTQKDREENSCGAGCGYDDILIVGQSFGGNLALGLVLDLLKEHMMMATTMTNVPSSLNKTTETTVATRLPLAVALLSPWIDLTHSGDSQITLQDVDPTLSVKHFLAGASLAYAVGNTNNTNNTNDKNSVALLSSPAISPLFAVDEVLEKLLSWTASTMAPSSSSSSSSSCVADDSPSSPPQVPTFPPTVLSSGTRDLLLSDSVRLAKKLRRYFTELRNLQEKQNKKTAAGRGGGRVGGGVELNLSDGMWHVFEWDPNLPESAESVREIADFLRRYVVVA